MATFDIKMPKMGESVTECTITVLNVKVGDYIEEDTDLFEITSAKTAATIPSPVAGTIVKINYGEGDTVAVGEPVIIVDTSGQHQQQRRKRLLLPLPPPHPFPSPKFIVAR